MASAQPRSRMRTNGFDITLMRNLVQKLFFDAIESYSYDVNEKFNSKVSPSSVSEAELAKELEESIYAYITGSEENKNELFWVQDCWPLYRKKYTTVKSLLVDSNFKLLKAKLMIRVLNADQVVRMSFDDAVRENEGTDSETWKVKADDYVLNNRTVLELERNMLQDFEETKKLLQESDDLQKILPVPKKLKRKEEKNTPVQEASMEYPDEQDPDSGINFFSENLHEMLMRQFDTDENQTLETALIGKDDDVVSEIRDQFQTRDDAKFSITRCDLRTLQDGQWVNDHIINSYFSILIQDNQYHQYPYNFKMYHSFVYTKAENKKDRDNFFRRFFGKQAIPWWKKVGDEYTPKFETIFFPVHIDNNHWTLAVVDFNERKISHYDSFEESKPDVVENIKYLVDFQYKHQTNQEKGLDFTTWKVDDRASCPKQKNGFDCGPFVMACATYLSNKQSLMYTQDDMPHLRKRFMLEILKNDLRKKRNAMNEEEKMQIEEKTNDEAFDEVDEFGQQSAMNPRVGNTAERKFQNTQEPQKPLSQSIQNLEELLQIHGTYFDPVTAYNTASINVSSTNLTTPRAFGNEENESFFEEKKNVFMEEESEARNETKKGKPWKRKNFGTAILENNPGYFNDSNQSVTKFQAGKSDEFVQQSAMNPRPKNPTPTAYTNFRRIRGLNNRGNDCFYNAVLQCLFSTSSFFNELQNAPFLSSKGIAFQKLADEMRPLNQPIRETAASPLTLYAHFRTTFRNDQQHDAFEFLTQLLDDLHGDLAQNESTGNTEKLTADSVNGKYAPIIADTLISNTFFGKEKTVQICANTKCKPTILSSSRLTSLNLAITEQATTLGDLIRDYKKEEHFERRCETCGNETTKKKIKISEFPNHLIVNLKRVIFYQGKYSKETKYINCPSTLEFGEKITYDLYAFIVHNGNATKGHYVAYAKCSTQNKAPWFCFDDAKVDEIESSDVTKIRKQSSILFYKERASSSSSAAAAK